MNNPRELLQKHESELSYDPETVTIDDVNAFTELHPALQEWWINNFGKYVEENNGLFTPPQKQAIPRIKNGENTLIASPTGTGKTLASFTSVLSDLFERAENDTLENSVFCLYVSPLKSLANDIHRNLSQPLKEVTSNHMGDDVEVRHAIRHGDTSDKEKQKMLTETPHILNTTPETLAILLNSPRFKEKLRTVEYVIVDEIHSLADNKRGTHLSVSLERLERMANTETTRIGCSATVEPLETVGDFLVGRETPNGESRGCEIVDTRFERDYDIEVESPVDDLITTSRSEINNEFYSRLHHLITDHSTTIIFTNTRSGAESALANLRREYDDFSSDNSACHHGSLSKSQRETVEQKLKNGELDFVTTSTSLELGIDMQDVDLVVQIGSPKSIAALLQRVGRAGHRLGKTIEGRVIVLDRDELIECSVMAKRAEEGFIDRVFIPENCQDVAAQHVYGMAINGPVREEEVKDVLRQAYPYRQYSEDEYEQLMKYLELEYEGLEEYNVYSKVWRDTNDPPDGEHHYEDFDVGEWLIGKRGRLAQMIYMTNIGTIPDTFSCDVVTRNDDQWVGNLDEEYLDTLEKEDVFTLGGNQYEFRYRRGSKVYVDETNASPTVPRWFSERLPLSYDLGWEILEFQREVVEILTTESVDSLYDHLYEEFPINEKAAAALADLYYQQLAYAGTESVTTQTHLSIEEHLDDEGERNYYVQTGLGRKFNDGFSRILAQRVAEQHKTNVEVAVNDHGFSISVPQRININVPQLIAETEPERVPVLLRNSIRGTDFLQRNFRINATRSFLVLANYKGHSKSAAKQQMDSEMVLGAIKELDDFAVLEETYRELMEDKLDLDKLEDFIGRHTSEENMTQYTVTSPSPRAFGIATLASSDVVFTDDEAALLQEFHETVLNEID